jgi:DNA-binding ferritin-like protein (Dps family)
MFAMIKKSTELESKLSHYNFLVKKLEFQTKELNHFQWLASDYSSQMKELKQQLWKMEGMNIYLKKRLYCLEVSKAAVGEQIIKPMQKVEHWGYPGEQKGGNYNLQLLSLPKSVNSKSDEN